MGRYRFLYVNVDLTSLLNYIIGLFEAVWQLILQTKLCLNLIFKLLDQASSKKVLPLLPGLPAVEPSRQN